MAILLTCLALASCNPVNNSGSSVSETASKAESKTAVSGKTETSGENTAPAQSSQDKTESTAGDVSAEVSVNTEMPAVSDMFSGRDYEIGYSDGTSVKLSAGAASVSGDGAVSENGRVTITKAGTYVISGTISEGQIIVDADGEKVQIVLDNADITCTGSAAIYVKAADKVFVTTAEGSTNSLTSKGEFTADGETNVDGTVFAKSDITFNGAGTLSITSETAHGIVCKDDVKFTSGTYGITAAKKGIDCSESVRMAGGTVNITSGTDGIHAENSKDASKGFVYIAGGKITITSGQDGIDASGDVSAADGTLEIVSGGGSASAPAHKQENPGMRFDRDTSTSDSGETTESSKGIKSASLIAIAGGTITVDANDDALHSDGSLYINGGTVTAKTGDDGIHAEDTVLISDGNVDISGSYEGIEGEVIEISGGIVNVVASDDGMNAAGDGSTTDSAGFGGCGGSMDTDSSAKLTISGGTVTVNANGDGLDSNGCLYVTGGTTYISGPVNGGNGAFDYGISGTITGGTLIAAGSSGMAENFGQDSTQGSILYMFDTTISGGTKAVLSDESGTVIAEYTPEKDYQSIVISTPAIKSGKTYTLSVGGKTYTVEMTSLIYGSGNGMGGFGGGRNGQGGFGGRNGQGGGFPQQGENGEMPQMPDGNFPQQGENGGTPPQMPDGNFPQQGENGGTPPQMPDGNFPQQGENGGTPPQMPGGNFPQMQDGGFRQNGGRGNRENNQKNDSSQT